MGYTCENIERGIQKKKKLIIHNVSEKLVFDCVGFFSKFSSSLAPCARTMVARSRQKNLRSRLAKFQFFKHFRYIHNVSEKLVFDCVGFFSKFSSSLAPCARTMVARSRSEF